jgi:hypothetical protein
MHKPMSGGNGDNSYTVVAEDMGGWVRVFAVKAQGYPESLPLALSHELTEWFRKFPTHFLRCVVPVVVDGNVRELHAWYDVHTVPAKKVPAAIKPS